VVESPRKPRSLPKILSVEDVSRLLAQAEADIANARDPAETAQRIRFRALLELLYATGMRVSELVGLPYRVLAEGGRFLIIRGKGAKERMVPMSRPARLGARCLDRAYRRGRGRGRLSVPGQFERGPFVTAGLRPRAQGSRRARRPAMQPRSRRMCFGMPSQATFWPVVRICARSRNCSDTPISRPPKSTLTCSTNGSSSWSAEHHPLAKPPKNRD
jgi:integrase